MTALSKTLFERSVTEPFESGRRPMTAMLIVPGWPAGVVVAPWSRKQSGVWMNSMSGPKPSEPWSSTLESKSAMRANAAASPTLVVIGPPPVASQRMSAGSDLRSLVR